VPHNLLIAVISRDRHRGEGKSKPKTLETPRNGVSGGSNGSNGNLGTPTHQAKTTHCGHSGVTNNKSFVSGVDGVGRRIARNAKIAKDRRNWNCKTHTFETRRNRVNGGKRGRRKTAPDGL
jgi:hypothetical protein